MPSETRTVAVPGGRLRAAIDGDGPPILLVPAGIVVPGTKRVVLPDVAHMVGMEAPERLVELVVELLHPIGSWA